MDAQAGNSTSADKLFTDWMKSLTDVWGAFTPRWPDPSAASPTPSGRLSDTWQTWLKTLQTTFGLASRPETMEMLTQALQIAPDVFGKFSQIGLASFASFQKQVQERFERFGESVKPYDFQELDREALHLWTEFYEKEIRQYFNIPQIGLLRIYQENTLAALDRYNLMQSEMAEFFQLLYLPVEKTFKVLQDQIQQQAQSGQLVDDPKTYYQQWVKILEGHYMTLFQSPEYTRVLGSTIRAFSDYWIARREVLQDVLKTLTIPTQSELDELYRELYELKKEVKSLKKQTRATAANR